MHISVNDGVAVFPHKVFRAAVDRKDEATRRRFGGLQVEADCVVCYTPEEAQMAEAALRELGISYIDAGDDVGIEAGDGSEPGAPKSKGASETRSKVQGIKYASRTELLEHVQQGREPKSRELQVLRERIEALETEIRALKAK